MFQAQLRKMSAPALRLPAAHMSRLGAHANLITVVGFVVGLGAIPAIATHHYWLGLALIVLNRVCDALDGAVARQNRASPLGQFLDMTLDLIFFAGLPFAFALADPARGLAATFFMFGILASGASGLAFTVVAQEQGAKVVARGYTALGGLARLMEDEELFVAFILACIAPQWFSVVAYIVGVLCFMTAGARIAFAAARLSP
ncbi:MAG: CDP-alcohol phosphatidyltransferase family protein [Rhizomicrobium sp.]